MARTIILATHGHLGEAVREACELVMGKQEDVDVMSIVAGVGADDIYHFFCDKIREAMEKKQCPTPGTSGHPGRKRVWTGGTDAEGL